MSNINVNQPGINLDSFSKLAAQQQNENRRLQLKEGGVAVAGAWSKNNPDANREAIEAFSKVLRAKYGDAICNMASIRGILEGRHAAGKALTGRMVLDMVKLAGEEFKRVNAHNAKVVEQFISGQDAGGHVQNQNLEKAIEKFCQSNGIPPEHQAKVQSRALAFLRAEAERNGFSPAILTLKSLMEGVGKGWEKYAGPASSLLLVLDKDGQRFPGKMEDKLRLVDLGVTGENSALQRAIWELGQMRQIQPQGELTHEALWKALFNENSLPNEVLSGAKTFAAALAEKHAADCLAMTRDLGFKEGSFQIRSALHIVSWSTLTAMQQNMGKAVLTLEHLPGAAIVTPQIWDDSFKMGKVIESLNRDLHRASGAGVIPPEVTFTFSNGSKETIQFGRDTNFVFADNADKKAYLLGNDNSLTRRIQMNCTGITGSDGQLRGTMLCLTQAPLILLKEAAKLNGSGFDEHSPISVNFSRRPNGMVRAEFSSPQGSEATAGRFSMVIDIEKDGTLALRSFELTPPGFFREQALEGQRSRLEDAWRQAIPLLALDNSPDGLMTAMRQRLTMVSNPRLTENSLSPILPKIVFNISKAAYASTGNLSLEQIRGIRDTMLDELCASFAEAAGKIPLDQRDAFINASLATGVFPRPDLAPVIGQMAGEVKNVLGDLLAATDVGEARGLLSELQRIMTAVTNTPEFEAKGYGMDEFVSAGDLAMRMGLMALIGQGNPDAALRGLTRQGSPFRDMLYGLAHDSGESYQGTANAYNWFRKALEDIVSPETMKRLDMHTIRECDLSFDRQREILGHNIAARGAEVAAPILSTVNEILVEQMPNIKALVLSETQTELTNGPATGSDPSSHMSKVFQNDFQRDGFFVNGKYHHPAYTNTTVAAFKNLFPEPYVAEKLSNLVGQNLNAILETAVFNDETLKNQLGTERHIEFFGLFHHHPAMLHMDKIRSNRIDTVDAQKGRYRVSAYFCNPANDDNYGIERYMYEISVDVDLGPPGANPRPAPVVRDARVNFLARGRELVPGEQLERS